MTIRLHFASEPLTQELRDEIALLGQAISPEIDGERVFTARAPFIGWRRFNDPDTRPAFQIAAEANEMRRCGIGSRQLLGYAFNGVLYVAPEHSRADFGDWCDAQLTAVADATGAGA